MIENWGEVLPMLRASARMAREFAVSVDLIEEIGIEAAKIMGVLAYLERTRKIPEGGWFQTSHKEISPADTPKMVRKALRKLTQRGYIDLQGEDPMLWVQIQEGGSSE